MIGGAAACSKTIDYNGQIFKIYLIGVVYTNGQPVRRKTMKEKILGVLAVLLILLTLTPCLVQAQSYAISWWTVDGGGGTSTGGGYTLSGTIGQPDAGVMGGGGYTLTGGFWGLDLSHYIFLPLILRN